MIMMIRSTIRHRYHVHVIILKLGRSAEFFFKPSGGCEAHRIIQIVDSIFTDLGCHGDHQVRQQSTRAFGELELERYALMMKTMILRGTVGYCCCGDIQPYMNVLWDS